MTENAAPEVKIVSDEGAKYYVDQLMENLGVNGVRNTLEETYQNILETATDEKDKAIRLGKILPYYRALLSADK